ncbi:MAG: 4-(cytidine 5'-diphospho)-2-C-methyl-D-erythritol kinase [Gemmataceae bacterium]
MNCSLGASVTLLAPAKVNLFLEVLARRADGYHQIETVMVAVSLFDQVDLVPATELRLSCSDPAIPSGPENLAFRAALALKRAANVSAGAHIHLTKNIPAQAGLAGGSSDAATTLVGLNRLWNLNLSQDRLSEIAAEIGSDVAFFLFPPAARCTGRGEKVEPIPVSNPLHLVLVCPVEGLSTADVYRRVAVPASVRSSDAICAALQAGDAQAIGQELFNRLQEPAEALSATVKRLRMALSDIAPKGCLMSGSGSSLFALCDSEAAAQKLAQRLRVELTGDPAPRVFVVRTVD